MLVQRDHPVGTPSQGEPFLEDRAASTPSSRRRRSSVSSRSSSGGESGRGTCGDEHGAPAHPRRPPLIAGMSNATIGSSIAIASITAHPESFVQGGEREYVRRRSRSGMSSRCPRNRTTSPRPSRSTIRSSSDDEEPFRPAIRTSSRGWVSRSDEAASTRYRWPLLELLSPDSDDDLVLVRDPEPPTDRGASRRGTAAEAIGIPTTLDHRDPRGVESHVAHRPISDRVRDRVEVIRQHPRGDHVDRTDGRQRCPPNPGILETDGRIGRVHQTREDDGT